MAFYFILMGLYFVSIRAETNPDSRSQAHDVSKSLWRTVGNCAGCHSSYIVAKDQAAVCPCPEYLHETELESNRLVILVGKFKAK